MSLRRKILVADGSETIIAVCRQLLTKNGYDVTVYQDGTKALEELKRNDYDIAVVATTTQNVSGYFVVQELRKDRARQNLPILMLLGSSELLDTRELVQVGPYDTLSKPFSPQELLFKIDKLLKQGLTAASGEAMPPDEDIESILAEDENSFEKKISSATDKIFLNMLKQTAGETPEAEAPRLDKLDLTEDQYDVEAVRPEKRAEEDSPHDYDWFIREMSGDEHKRGDPKPQPYVPQGPSSGKFQVEEIGSTKVSLSQLKKMQSTEEDTKTKVYIEKLNAPLVADTDLRTKSINDSGALDTKSLFIKFFAEALARELAQNIDFDKLIARLSAGETQGRK